MSVHLHTIELPPTPASPTSHQTCGRLVLDMKRRVDDCRKLFEQSTLCQPGGGYSGGLSMLVELLPNPRCPQFGICSLLTWHARIGAPTTPPTIRSRIPDGFQHPRLFGDAAHFYGPFKMRSAGLRLARRGRGTDTSAEYPKCGGAAPGTKQKPCAQHQRQAVFFTIDWIPLLSTLIRGLRQLGCTPPAHPPSRASMRVFASADGLPPWNDIC
ncbi:hypothetical protein BJV78DRAFT_576318 [Lactifluus subvellereus]|nr:hypothetical protein BJV78DRAFT_576318 [Lactifluus subvellereus]